MKPTIRDVAKAAGVSISMVSRVLTGRGYVRQEKKERVLKVIKEIGYHPSALAKGLRDKRTRTLGLLFSWLGKPSASDHFYREVLSAVLETTAERGYQLLISNFVGRLDDDEGHVCKQFIHDSRVEGVLILAPRVESNNLVKLIEDSGSRVILVSHTEPSLSYVDADQEEGVEKGIDYLMEKGHKDIGFITGETSLNSNAHYRYKAFLSAMKARNVTVDPAWIRKGRFDEATGESAAKAFIKMDKAPTAVITSSDHQAVGMMGVYRELPREQWCEIVTFDDRPESKDRGYPVSSLRQPFYNIGKIATEEMIRGLEEDVGKKVQITVPLELVKRG